MIVRRRKKAPAVISTDGGDGGLAAFLTHGTRRPKADQRGRKLSELEAAMIDAEKRSASGDWDGVGGATLVGLYAVCHRMVYGVPPADLAERASFARAAKIAAGCMHKHFADDRDAVVEFVRWSWVREEGREQWAARNGQTRNRLGFLLQFSPSLVTDYRVDQQRGSRGRKR